MASAGRSKSEIKECAFPTEDDGFENAHDFFAQSSRIEQL